MAWSPIIPLKNHKGVKSDIATYSITRKSHYCAVNHKIRISISREFGELYKLKKGDKVMLLADTKDGKPILGIRKSNMGFSLQQKAPTHCFNINAVLPATFPVQEECSSTEIKLVYVNNVDTK